ncbi:MAG TPA: cytochrome P450 [Nocardioides sp.]|uniref:cytochrome P450 n=1 Tax=Nocardioides sp. TaxID=35761 RepID=UPI002F408B54
MDGATDDVAWRLWREGYDALPRMWDADPRAYAEDALRARMFGRPCLVVRGEPGARFFYDESVVARRGAVPRPLSGLLFGRGAVHGLDDEEHRRRKAMFLETLSSERTLTGLVEERLTRAVRRWPELGEFSLHDELVRCYGGAALDWAGIGVGHFADADRISRRLAAIVAGFGLTPAPYARGWAARWWADAWAERIVRRTRAGRMVAPAGTVLDRVKPDAAWAELPPRVAAVELLNVLRPAVAVAWLGTFAGWELVRHPGLGPTLADPGQEVARRAFVQEVRRVSPFVPALLGRVRRETTWQGHELDVGDAVLLDVPGTNRHPSWGDPDRFRPERFMERPVGEFELVPQGGGDVRTGHRCPGEDLTASVLDRTVERLAGVSFRVSSGAPDRQRIPALPRLGLRLSGVRV